MTSASAEVSEVGSRSSHGIRDTPELQLRVHGSDALPTLLHLPGLHGDWTLLGPFRRALAGRARLVETTYPREPGWTLANYARAITKGLVELGIERCWILGESFSSQVAWELLRPQANRPEVTGLILVGGFIRHPWPWGVKLAHRVSCRFPHWVLRRACSCYAWLARKRCPNSESTAELEEFVARRITSLDRVALNSRYQLIADNDPSSIARATTLPVFQLSGAWDPLVPWWQVRPWLRRHCPGYVASRIVWSGSHNVLMSSPAACADQILGWLAALRRG
ncbi:MAG TPA: alpha/beta hydrolase [Verrucomicrobiae bacterium]|nr:alpha/beta hydrolase [Verrucomicrobiae bacterium]